MKRAHYAELVVPLVCGALIVLCAFWLYLDFSSKGEGEGEAVGKVAFHVGKSGRRPAGRVTWGRLEAGDPVYRNDTVRTADDSEALLDLNDGTGIEMDPLSMIVLNLRDDVREIEVLEGSILLRPGALLGRWRVKDGEETRQLRDAVGPMRLTRDADGRLRLSVATAAEDAPANDTKPGEASKNLSAAGDSPPTGPAPLAPPENRRYFTGVAGPDGRQEVVLRWRGEQGQSYELTVARDRLFQDTVLRREVRGLEAADRFGPGRYYWRVRGPDGRPGPLARFSVLPREQPRLIAPAAGARFQLGAGAGGLPVVFAWKSSRAPGYRLEVARDADFQRRIVERRIRRNGITLRFPPGDYYWRLTALGSFPESDALSEARSFSVRSADADDGPKAADEVAQEDREEARERPVVVARPLPVFPEMMAAVDMSTRNSIPFRWSPVAGARFYLFRLYNIGNRQAPVFALRTSAPYLNFTRLELLDEGEFFWTVDANVPDAPGEFVRGHGRFVIMLSEQPDRPELELE